MSDEWTDLENRLRGVGGQTSGQLQGRVLQAVAAQIEATAPSRRAGGFWTAVAAAAAVVAMSLSMIDSSRQVFGRPSVHEQGQMTAEIQALHQIQGAALGGFQ